MIELEHLLPDGLGPYSERPIQEAGRARDGGMHPPGSVTVEERPGKCSFDESAGRHRQPGLREGGDMPNITFDGPRIDDLGRKRELVRKVTEAAVEAYGLPKQAMIILIKENDPENVGIGGELLADRPGGNRPD